MSGYDSPWEKMGVRDDGYWVDDPRKYRDVERSEPEQMLKFLRQDYTDTFGKGIPDVDRLSHYNMLRQQVAKELMGSLKGLATDEDMKRINQMIPGAWEYAKGDDLDAKWIQLEDLLRSYQK